MDFNVDCWTNQLNQLNEGVTVGAVVVLSLTMALFISFSWLPVSVIFSQHTRLASNGMYSVKF